MPARSLSKDVLHIFAVANFAFAYPILDHMGYDPWFYIVERATALDVVLLALTVSLLLPMVLAGVRALAQLVSPVVGNLVQPLVIAGLLIAGTVHTVARRSDPENLLTYSVIAIIICIFATWLYLFLQPVQFFISVLSISVIAVPIYFLTMTEASRIVFPDRQEAVSQPLTEAPDVPIVFIVVDELPTISLLDAEMMIDRDLYPNIAGLADDSYWFRNATANSYTTSLSVPSILTGSLPDFDGLAHYHYHPDNVFTLLSESHGLYVDEVVTELCPRDICETDALSMVQRLDLLRRGSMGDNVRRRASDDDRPDRLRTAASGVGETSDQTPFFFVHSMLPHAPWWYLPSGNRFTNDISQPSGVWTSQVIADHEYQKHLAQTQFTDSLVGEILSELVDAGVYDESIIVFTADHGVSFQRGVDYRKLEPENAADILYVPLIIKFPSQTEGVISDRNVQLIDVLPTIADALDIEIPWPVDGVSAIDESVAAPDYKTALLHDSRDLMILEPEIPGFQESLEHKLALFGDGSSPNGLYTFGPYASIVGQAFLDVLTGRANHLLIELDDDNAVRNVQPDSGFVPALITGRVEGISRDSRDLPYLAVAVNVHVEAVGRVFDEDGEFRFSILVPEDALKAGNNYLDIAVVEGTPDAPSIEVVDIDH